MLHPRRGRDREHGQIMILFALSLVVVLAFAAIVVDLGLLRNNRQKLVNTLDAAALAGGVFLPVDGSVAADVTKMNNLIVTTIAANYPGLPTSAYTVTYKCLVGVDPATNLAWVSRDVPAACNPTHGVGHTPVAADFTGAGPTRNSPCTPSAGDKCNVVTITGSATTPFSLGGVVGVTSGSTGGVQSAACNGPCGNSPVLPVDLVIILDRTLSMTGSSGGYVKITALQDAAKAVLDVYNPAKQRVGLALTGPSMVIDASGTPKTSASCSGSAYGYFDNNNWTPYATVKTAITALSTTIQVTTATGVPFPASATPNFTIVVDSEQMTVTNVATISGGFTWTVTRPTAATTTSTAKAAHNVGAPVYGLVFDPSGVAGWVPRLTTVGMWVPVGLSGTDTALPAAYNPGGTGGNYKQATSEIVKAINCISAQSDGTDLATPIKMAQWYLDHYGRPGVTQGIILETDGHPQYGFGGGVQDQANTSLAYTCKAAADAAAAAKADTTNTAIDPTLPQGIQIFTIGYGVTGSTYCPTYTSNRTDGTITYNTYEGTDGRGVNWSGQQATTLLSTMATDASHYYENPTSAQLKAIFTDAATKLAKGGAHLVQLCPAPIVNSISPTTWTTAGTQVTITGQYFTGTTQVKFGGTAGTSLIVTGDTQIKANAPGGTASVLVMTPCGTN